MKRFRLLEHTADIGIEATAGEREGLAEQTGFGLRFLLYGKIDVPKSVREEVTGSGHSPEETLVNWLNELLYVMTDGGVIPSELRIIRFSDDEIVAEVDGAPGNVGKYPLQREIKAVTHHQTTVEQVADGWRSRVYLDL